MSIPAAWHPDPTGRHDHRWWDGERWTEHVADAGRASIDPIDAGPPEAGAGADVTGEPAGAGSAAGEPADGEPGGGEPGGGEPAGSEPARGEGTDAWVGSEPSTPQPAWRQPSDQPQWSQPGQPGEQTHWGQPGQAGEPAAWQQPGGGVGAGPPAQPGTTWPTHSGGPPGGPGTGMRTDGMAIGAIVVGVLSLLIAFVPVIGLLGFVGGIIALVLGIVAVRRIRTTGAPGRGQAITGIVTGSLAILITIIWIAVIVAGFRGAGGFGMFHDYAECIEETGDQELCDERLQRDLTRRFFGD